MVLYAFNGGGDTTGYPTSAAKKHNRDMHIIKKSLPHLKPCWCAMIWFLPKRCGAIAGHMGRGSRSSAHNPYIFLYLFGRWMFAISEPPVVIQRGVRLRKGRPILSPPYP